MGKNLAQRSAMGISMLVLATAGTAHAQSSASGLTFGTPSREIGVKLSGDATYDTNVARSSNTGISRRGVQKEDMRLSPAVEANIVLPTAAVTLTLVGSVGYDFYVRNDQLNRERIDVTGGAGTKLAICDVATFVGYSRRQNDLADLSIVPGNPTASTVNVQSQFRVGGSATCGSANIRPTAFVEYRTSDNSASQRTVSNVNTLTYGGGVSYSSPAFGILTAFAGRSEFDYPDRDTVIGALQSFNATRYGVRLDRRLGARLQVNGQLSYVDVESGTGAGDNFDGLNWDVAASLRAGERSRISVYVSRQLDSSAAFNLRNAQVTTYGGDIAYALSPLLRANVAVSRRERDFNVDPALTTVIVLSNDTINEISGGLVYLANQRLSYSLSAAYQDRTANVAVYRYNSFRTVFGVKLRI